MTIECGDSNIAPLAKIRQLNVIPHLRHDFLLKSKQARGSGLERSMSLCSTALPCAPKVVHKWKTDRVNIQTITNNQVATMTERTYGLFGLNLCESV